MSKMLLIININLIIVSTINLIEHISDSCTFSYYNVQKYQKRQIFSGFTLNVQNIKGKISPKIRLH
jgi:hypothetical protein